MAKFSIFLLQLVTHVTVNAVLHIKTNLQLHIVILLQKIMHFAFLHFVIIQEILHDKCTYVHLGTIFIYDIIIYCICQVEISHKLTFNFI